MTIGIPETMSKFQKNVFIPLIHSGSMLFPKGTSCGDKGETPLIGTVCGAPRGFGTG